MGFQGIGLDNIQFLTVPNEYYPADSEFSGRVFWTKQAQPLWRAIRLDEEVPQGLLGGAISAGALPGEKKPGGGGGGNGGGSAGQTPEEAQAEAEASGLCA
jgi:hypothetical protein